MTLRRAAAALAVAAAACLLYRRTLLPGLDFGDTASFQAVAGSPIISPRDGYPLYFAIGGLLLHVMGGDPAHTLNLASAIEGATAAGLLVPVAAELSGSLVAGVGAALLFAGSYTFWSQAIIAEVYALHALLVALTLLLLLHWQARPSTARLALFFAVYALGFGNHLSMILLLPGYAAFLLIAAPGGWRSMLRPGTLALAVAMAAAGAMQYAWNVRTLWFDRHPPAGLADGLAAAWFDITKSDWRSTMVFHVPRAMLADRAAMYLFDLRQQFGWPAVALVAPGVIALWRRSRLRALLLAGVYLPNVLFAYSYNVGDAHVFYLPSHLAVALAAAPGAVWAAHAAAGAVGRLVPPPHRARVAAAGTALLALYASARIYADYPALDRSGDRRPEEALDRLTAGLDDRRAILVADLNWQVQNGLTYYASRVRRDLAVARLADVLLYLPALIADNLDAGREVVFTARAKAAAERAYGPLIDAVRDPGVLAPTIADLASSVVAGTRYVLAVLKPAREFALDAADLTHALAALTGGTVGAPPPGDYLVVAGLAGQRPALVAAADRPFRTQVELDGTPVEIRLDSWLAADTIRRMGFGHVIAARRHTLIIERGVSFAAFDRAGRPLRSGYAAGLFAPEPRYVCYR